MIGKLLINDLLQELISYRSRIEYRDFGSGAALRAPSAILPRVLLQSPGSTQAVDPITGHGYRGVEPTTGTPHEGV